MWHVINEPAPNYSPFDESKLANTKQCPKCKLTKKTTEFYRDKSHKDGLQCHCKSCNHAARRKYAQSTAGKARRRKYDNLPNVKARQATYNSSPKRKSSKAAYRKTDAGRLSSCWSRIKYRYGITKADYDVMFKAQGGCCAICGKEPRDNTGNMRLVVDHCHTTGKIRGLLCKLCNCSIGFLNDDVNLVFKAYTYLAANKKKGRS